jgi:hypothetical protein
MGVVSPFVSLAEYLKIEAPAGMKDELIKGEVFISPAAKPNHALIVKRLLRLLDDAVDSARFEVNCDMSVILDASDPASMPRADVFVMDRVRFRMAAAQDRYPEGSPELPLKLFRPAIQRRNSQKRPASMCGTARWPSG